ncbi:hypothetical protein SAMN05421837_106189 [Amycolatopsis pretoriensis]|uniref:DUF5753 domain-containing protein n=1 Tax=Amycolatopsis pretoriensis TaxID=218821 RepID=A0A1H5R2S8_9PSEU|nr:Scr1 family TA system antitoxin-like transcriptional regulator [Amycolatopsis pretoriensis]SEF32354.1 hypothetical protein SAMN05421837_106189 [Amycolatopsis pretoriensis]
MAGWSAQLAPTARVREVRGSRREATRRSCGVVRWSEVGDGGGHENRTRRYTFLIGETALRTCPAYVYTDQVEYLRTLANRPNVTIQIVPSDACPPGFSSFTAYQQDKITLAVAVRHRHATSYFSARDTLGRYHRTMRWLSGHALDIADALSTGNPATHPGAHGGANAGGPQHTVGSG